MVEHVANHQVDNPSPLLGIVVFFGSMLTGFISWMEILEVELRIAGLVVGLLVGFSTLIVYVLKIIKTIKHWNTPDKEV